MVATLILVAISGCFAGPPGSAGPPSSTTDGNALEFPRETSTIVLRFEGNQTTVVPVEVPPDTTFVSRVSYVAPRDGGVRLAYFNEADQDPILFSHWGIPEFSERKTQNALTEEFEEECWSGRVRTSTNDAPCALRNRPNGPYNDADLNDEGMRIPVGLGYFMASGFQVQNASITVVLNQPVTEEARTTVENLIQVKGTESFDAEYQDIEVCGDVVWCGHIIDGKYEVSTGNAGYAHVLVRGVANVERGAFFKMCVAESTESTTSDCVDPLASGSGSQVVPSTLLHFTVNRILTPDDSGLVIEVDAAAVNHGLGYNPWFAVDGWITPFDLPPVHPLAK